MYVTDIPVMDRITDRELEQRESHRADLTNQSLSVHVWAARHTGKS